MLMCHHAMEMHETNVTGNNDQIPISQQIILTIQHNQALTINYKNTKSIINDVAESN